MDTDALIQAPIGVLAVLLVCVVAAERLARLPALRKFGAALLVIVIAAVLANLRIIPPVASSNPVYEFIFSYVISGSIFLLLLQVNLGALKRAGSQMLGAFALGALGVCAGALLAAAIVPFGDLIGDNKGALAGMFAGTYIGGSANFNAVAEVMEVTRESGLYTAATVVDNVMTDIWILVTLALSALLVRTPWFKKAVAPAAPAPEEKAHADDAAPLSVMDVALPLALAALALWASSVLSGWLEARGITIPSILFVTTLALMAAQVPAFSRFRTAHAMGLWAVYLFLAVVGANADIGALAAAGALTPLLFLYVTIIFTVHGAILIGGGALFKIDPAAIAVASAANVGGGSTAFVVAEAEGRQDLVLPGILVGSIGTAIGTYAGFAIALALR